MGRAEDAELETTVSCLLLTIPGYNHCPQYRKKWEERLDIDPWRLVDEHRWLLPLMSGHVKGPDGEEPAIIALSFTPRGASRIASLQNAIQFFRDPHHAELRFRTIVISRIRDIEACESFPVTLMSSAASQVTEKLRQVLSGPVPANFVVKENLLDYLFGGDPRELLRAVGLVTEREEEEDEIEGEEAEFDDSEWEESDWESEDEEWESDIPKEEEDSVPASLFGKDEEDRHPAPSFSPMPEEELPPPGVYAPSSLDEEEKTEREGGVVPPPPPERPATEEGGAAAEQNVTQTIRHLYRPDPQTLRAYGIDQEDEGTEPSLTQQIAEFLPPWPHLIAEIVISALSYFVPQASWGMFLLAGGRAGLRMLVGAAFLQLLFFFYQAGIGVRYWWGYAIVAILGIAFYFAGIKRLYARDHLKFELATVSKRVANTAWQAIRSRGKSDANTAAATAAVPGAVTVRDIGKGNMLGAIPDFLFLLSPLLFVYPPLHPIGVAVFLLLWHMERKRSTPWTVGIIVHTILKMVGHPLSVKAEVVLWFFRLVSYVSVRSNNDLTVEKIRDLPRVIREFYRMFIVSPIGALKFIWSGKKVRVRETVEFEVRPVDDKMSAMINALPERTLANILSCLTPEQCEGWIRAAETAGVAVPIVAYPKEQTKFYHITYRVGVPPVVRGSDIKPDYRSKMMAAFAQGMAQTRRILIAHGEEMEVPCVCRVSPQENTECALSPLPEAIVIGNGTGIIVPIGTSYLYYIENGKHKHYATGIVYDPDRSGHLMIVAPSGAGKSVFMRSLMNNLAAAAGKFPLRILYAEGKSELGGRERIEPFLTPFIFLSTGSIVLRWISALLSIMDYRQAFHAALGKYLKDPSPAKQLFVKRYGHILPQLIVVLDEYLAASSMAKQMEQISVTDRDGQRLRISAPRFYDAALALLVSLGRSMGVSMTFSTQSGRADAILSSLRDNCTMVVGNPGKISPQILSNLLGTDLTAMRQIAFQLTGNSAAHLPGTYGWAFSSPRGATVAWLKKNNTYILAGDALAFPEEQPQWDVLFPAFYPEIIPAPSMFPIQREAILRDIDLLTSAGLLPEPPVCGWLKALAIDPFDTEEEFLSLGESKMVEYLLRSKEQLSIDQQKSN